MPAANTPGVMVTPAGRGCIIAEAATPPPWLLQA
jgi:hypothetical protein